MMQKNCKLLAAFGLRALLALSLLWSSLLVAETGGQSVLLRKTFSGKIGYIATGASFREDQNSVDGCSFPAAPMSSALYVDMPSGAGVSVLEAYLYFAGSANAPSIDLDTQSLTLNGVALNTTAGFNDIDYAGLDDIVRDGVDFFGARRDVSSIVTGPGFYTFSGLEVSQIPFRESNQTCLGAWALVVIYEDTSDPQIRVINLFDGFQYFRQDSFDLQPRNFVADSPSPKGKMTHISFEGDETLFDSGEQFLFSSDGFIFDALFEETINPENNQYNSTVTSSDNSFFDRDDEYGLDVDTYAIDSYLTPGDYEAVTRYNAGPDLVLLMTEVIQIDNKPLADIEVTLNDLGTFQSGTTNSAEYLISVKNNGDGMAGPATGYAEGFINVYDDLPSGISIDNLSDITAPGWDCTGTDIGLDEVRCTYDLSSLSDSNANSLGDLNPGESLPDIVVTVDVATPASPVTNIAYVTSCGVNPDTCTEFDEKHTASIQFDPVNFFEASQNLFDILVKSGVNNNVDAHVTPIVTGTPSDLSTSVKNVAGGTNGTAQPGDVLTYTISLVESSGVANANDVTISDNIDPDTNSFNLTGNTCGGTDSFSLGVLTISGITISAGASCLVTYTVALPLSTNPGTTIDNTANITSSSGVGASPVAPTILVSGVATGSKVLYADALSGSSILTRKAPLSDSQLTLGAGASTTLTLSPLPASDLQINAGFIPISLWVEASTNSGPTYSVTAELEYQSGTAIGSDTVGGVTMTSGSVNAQLFPFQISLGSNITDLTTGEDITLDITNNSANSITIHAVLNGINSKVVIDAEDVVNVDSILFFSDAPRTVPIITPDKIVAGETIYIEAIVSDPFGFDDITDARLTLIDPNLGDQLTDVGMTEEVASQTSSTKTYTYMYVIPEVTSITDGLWVAQVTGFEGNEGTITHTAVNNFETTEPTVTVAYTVDLLTALPGDTLTYTITINNQDTGATSVDISQLVPVGTNNVSVITLPSGTNSSAGTMLDIQNISAVGTVGGGITVIEFTVVVLGSAQPGDLIDHTIFVDNMGTNVEAIAPSVLISPFGIGIGNKPLYGDAFNTVRRLDRTAPTTETTTTISSQGASQSFVLAPVLQSPLTLNAGDITASIWVSRGNASFAGQRTVQATLGYTGAANGTIDTDSVTVQFAGGVANAQYLPFIFSQAAAPLVLPANTSLTLTLTNTTAVAGETIIVHTYRDIANPSLISLDAADPLAITSIEYFDDNAANGGVEILDAAPGDTIWVRATISDPFGRDDITAANLVIEDPNSLETLVSTAMTALPLGSQPASLAEKSFEFSHVLSAELGDWITTVTAIEGVEGLVSVNDNAIINVNNNVPDLTDSYKFVSNTTTGDNSNTNPGDTLHYTIELINTGLAVASTVSLTDDIPLNTTFVAGTLTVDGVAQSDPGGGTISLAALTVPAGVTVTVEFDVVVDGGTGVGSLISNSADLTNPNGSVTSITVDAEDLVISGTPAVGTKLIYLESLDSAPFVTRAEPSAKNNTDVIELQNAGGTVTMDLDVPLRKDISIDPIDGDITITLRLQGTSVDGGSDNRYMTVELGYQSGGAVTSIGSQSRFVSLPLNDIRTETFVISVNAMINIATGNQLQLTVTNNQGNDRDINLYSYDTDGDSVRSSIALVPSPVINVDEISFWTDTLGAGSQLTNVDPTVVTDIYAKVVISDPFGEEDIQAPDAAVNPTTIVITDPDTNVTDTCTNTSGVAPCYEYDDEVMVPGDAIRTFYYLIRLAPSPPATRGTWTAQVTANEGLEVDVIKHVSAGDFTTSLAANLSTSTKSHNAVGDIGVGDIVTYTIILNNTGGVDADNVTFSDTLQTTVVALTFEPGSASTTCTDESAAALPAPAFAGGDVTLSNISVTVGGSCTIAFNVTVGTGTAGDFLDNSANIVNPVGAGSTPAAPTIIYLASQVPVAGSKQLYLDSLNSSPFLTRSRPSVASQLTINKGGSVTMDIDTPTTREMILDVGAIEVSLFLSRAGDGANRQTSVELSVDPGTGTFQTIGTAVQQNINLTATPSKRTINLNNPTSVTLPVGSIFRLEIQNNNTNANIRDLIVGQVTDITAPFAFSEIVLPLTSSIEVTELEFFEVSATDETGDPGCSPNCGTLIDPGVVVSGSVIWARTTIADGFGAFDVNTGSELCDGSTVANCPTITVTNPNSGSNVDDMTFIDAPDGTSRRYEFEIVPGGPFLEGIWQVVVEGSEGVEGVLADTRLVTFELLGQPNLTIVKSVDAPIKSPNTLAIYTNNVTNTGTGPATVVLLTNTLGDFVELQLTDNVGSWTALVSLSGGYTIKTGTEFFSDDGIDFTYDPNTEGNCTLPAASPCYDPAIIQWRIELDENIPASGNVIQVYRAKVL